MGEVDDTIQTDVSTGKETPQRTLSPREMAMANIEERLEHELEGQFVAAPEPAPAAAPAAAAATTAQPVMVEDPQQFLVTVKIEGKEEKKPLSEILAGYQKNETASERLRRASEKQKELEARERNLLEQERQIQLAGQLSVETTDTDDGLEQALGALAEGDTATAAQALREIIKGRQQQTTPQKINVADIAAQVEEKISTQNDWNDFLRENPEFREDVDGQGNPVYTKERQFGDFLFERDYAHRVESGELSYREALNQTAQEVRKVFSPPPAAAPSPEQVAREKKLERKKSIDHLPVAAGARASGEQQQEESRSDVISEMRKSRGLPA